MQGHLRAKVAASVRNYAHGGRFDPAAKATDAMVYGGRCGEYSVLRRIRQLLRVILSQIVQNQFPTHFIPPIYVFIVP
jgi:hypothetical protein